MRNTRRAEPSLADHPRGNFTPPARTAAAPAAVRRDPATEPPVSTDSRFAMRNWRVATRLNAILLIPVLVALVFGGFRVQSSVTEWQNADEAARTAAVVGKALTYSNYLLDERDSLVVPLLAGATRDAQVRAARARTDKAKAAFDEAVGTMPRTAALERRIHLIREGEAKLPALRAAAYTRKLPDVQTEEGYVAVQHPLMELTNELGFGIDNQAAYGRTLYAVSLTKAASSLTRSIGMHILVEDTSKLADNERKSQLTAFASYAYLQQVALEEFRGGGTDADQRLLTGQLAAAKQKGRRQAQAAAAKAQAAGKGYVTPPDMEGMVSAIAGGSSAKSLAQQGITPEVWYGASTLVFDAYRNVEKSLADQALSDAQNVASSAKRDAFINGAIVIVALIVAYIVATMIARSMSNSMRRLRSAALDVAEKQLPALVDQLSRTDPGRVDTRVKPIPITSQDEIGEVARAFDQVHREAVRLAAEQALLRGNVNAIFTNLSRRNQGLIQRQLTLITELENNEADPDQLENLFQLDHLATRMRRNGENLLVLAGEEPGRRWNQPVPLVDVLRAAASEVETYDRIELIGIPDTEIHGNAVTDLVHLLAELLENATTFSSPQTRVRVTATRLTDGRVMVEIHDKGIGLTAEDFSDINHKLADPPTVDATVSKRMGLFVVGRLCARHGIRVQLRPSGEQAGTTSLVMLPEPITQGGGGGQTSDDDFTVSRIMPEEPTGAYGNPQGAMSGAAELGDSGYEAVQVPDDACALDPVGRSLMREERRAQLEAADPADEQQPTAYQAQVDATEAAPEAYEEPPKGYEVGAYDPTAPGGYQPEGRKAGSYQANGHQGDSRNTESLETGAFNTGNTGSFNTGSLDNGSDTGAFETGSFEQQRYQGGAYRDYRDYRDYREPEPYQQPQAGTFQDPAGYQDGFQHGGYAGEAYTGDFPQQGWPARPPGAVPQPHPHPQPQPPATEEPMAPTASATPEAAAVPPATPHPQWGDPEPYETHFEQAEPSPAPSFGTAEGVGFDRPGPTASLSDSLTDAGLPRRARGEWQQAEHPGRPAQSQSPTEAVPQTRDDAPVRPSHEGLEWRSANDANWQRAAERAREPKAGGVTSSGLPRRVPKANLVPGAAEQTPQGGPHVSRAPEDVRGRLSNLRRGVQQGRKAGTDTNGQGFGPNHQER